MQRLLFALLAGGLFGAGLTVSGMIDTTKVQGWLDVFGDWDPTLAFVMGGAILPMAVAWRVSARMFHPVLGGAFPEVPRREVGPNLVIGAVLLENRQQVTRLRVQFHVSPLLSKRFPVPLDEFVALAIA